MQLLSDRGRSSASFSPRNRFLLMFLRWQVLLVPRGAKDCTVNVSWSLVWFVGLLVCDLWFVVICREFIENLNLCTQMRTNEQQDIARGNCTAD
jgi:hypothetical protein